MSSFYCRFLDNVLIPKSWGRAFEQMSDEEAGRLIKALFEYMDGKDPELEFRLKIVFNVMAQQAEMSAKRYCYKAGVFERLGEEYAE